MPLQLICGRAHCGKTNYIMNEIQKLYNSGNQVILIVPEQFTHIAEMRLIKTCGKMLDGHIEIMSFKKLAQCCFDKINTQKHRLTDLVGKSLIAASVVEQTDMHYYTKTSDYAGFVDMLLKEIGNFKKYGITPDMLDLMSRNNHLSDIFKAKIGDISKVYSEYEHVLHEKYIDSDDMLGILYSILNKSDILSQKTIFFDEFATFIPQERQIISCLIKQCKKVYISLCADSIENGDMNVFMPTVTTGRVLYDMCRENGYKYLPPIFLKTSRYNNKPLEFIEKNLYTYPIKKYGKTQNNINIYYAKNPYSEVEYAAKSIISLVRDGGFRFKNIGIICADISNYSHIFKNVFDKYEIPYFIDEKTDVLKHQTIQFIMSIFDVYLTGYDAQSIFNFLKSGYGNKSAYKISVCENFVNSSKITGRGWLDANRWQSIIENRTFRSKYEPEILNEIRNDCILPLANFHQKIKGKHTVKENVKNLYAYLCEIKLDIILKQNAEDMKQCGELKRAKEYESIWNILVNTLDTVYDFLGDEKVSPQKFSKYLICAFGQQSIGVIPTSLDEIIIGDIARTKTEYCDVLFIIGANDGVFPSPPADNSLITDSDRKQFDIAEVEYTRSSDIQAYFNQFLIYSVFTLANEKIFVSYSGADNSYKTISPAFIISKLKRMFADAEKTESEINDEETICGENVCYEHLAEILGDIKSRGIVPYEQDKWAQVYAYFKNNHKQLFDRLINMLCYTNNASLNDNDTVRALIGNEIYTTVSRLQKYNACKYSYFLAYMLNLKAPDNGEFKGIDIGNAAHSVFEHIGNMLNEKNISYFDLTDEMIEVEVGEYVKNLIDNYKIRLDNLTARNAFIIERMKSELVLCVKIIRSQITETEFKPLGYEMEFSDKSDIGTVNITLDSGETVKLTGKIDRADYVKKDDCTYIRVIDYKTGKKTFSLSNIINGLDLQLTVYLGALVKSDKHNRYGGAFYFTVSDPICSESNDIPDSNIKNKIRSELKLRGIVNSDDFIKNGNTDKSSANRINSACDEQFEIMDKYVNKIIKNSLSKLASGDISIKPYKNNSSTPCSYCEFSGICRFDEHSNGYREIHNYKSADDAWEVMKNEVDR